MEISLKDVVLLPLFRDIDFAAQYPQIIFHFLAKDERLAEHLRVLVDMKKKNPDLAILAITPDHFEDLVPEFAVVKDLYVLDIARDLFDELSYLHERYYHRVDLFPHCYIMNREAKVQSQGSLLQPQFTAKVLSSSKIQSPEQA